MGESKTLSVVISGNGISGLLLACLLQKKNISTAVIYSSNEKTLGISGDIVFDGMEYNILVSALQDVEGIFAYTLDKFDIDIAEIGSQYETIDVFLGNTGNLVYRNRDFNIWEKELASRFQGVADKLSNFFLVIKSIAAENWLALKKSSVGSSDMVMFMKYFGKSYRDFLESFTFPEELKDLLFSYAPWDGISLVTMCGYLSQITSVYTFDNFKTLQNRLLKIYTTLGGNYINGLVETTKKTETEYHIFTSDNECIVARNIVVSGDRQELNDLGVEVQQSLRPEKRFGSRVVLFETTETISSHLSYPVGYLRTFVNLSTSDYRVILSYLDRKVFKAEIIGPVIENDLDLILEQLQKKMLSFGFAGKLYIKKLWSFEDIYNETGIGEGQINQWAHSTSEILKNPLKSVEAAPGAYALGDWGNGFFYSAEIFSRSIIIREQDFHGKEQQ